MVNRVVLVGRLVRNPELKKTKNGASVVSFTLAVDRRGNGADFVDCVCWNATADAVAKYLEKGSLAAVDGSIQVRTWKDDEDRNRKTTEVVAYEVKFLSSPKKQEEEIELEDDELPF